MTDSRRAGETAPRYTSYPTAPHFHAGVRGRQVRTWMQTIPAGEAMSFYVHIPFCDRLCWFCACHTKHTLRYEPVTEYLDVLFDEIRLAGSHVPPGVVVRALHFGGGSPTMLKPADLTQLSRLLRDTFAFADDAEICVEIDPNDISGETLDALAAIGMTRASLGIQDFDPRVQRAINREQSFETTSTVTKGLRRRGVGSVNLDLVYGLPHQTVAGIAATVARVLTLAPDRIALFGYAHVPWFKKHQTMIKDAWLPDTEQRIAQSRRAAELILEAGYTPIGLDHFARPDDSLAKAATAGRLRRNFQGYTDDNCETLIGFGPSSISRYRQGYAQNTPAMGEYQRLVAGGTLPVSRGFVLSSEDRARAWVIERLMCDFSFSGREAVQLFGDVGHRIVEEARGVAGTEPDLLEQVGDLFSIRASARSLARIAASKFDPYLSRGEARHSVAV